ncbi:CMRF35-like molecule 6 isoform X2 [Macaca nemestrina]|uniref:CMRF35-like molecule 6 isoform X2 n=1 Tax=Macaca nemestrina TaxID=9545 RepID=UPI0039B8E71B
MTARAWASWRPSALLLLLVPGCFPLRGPSTVDGPVGGSLSVQCWYEEKYKTLNKYWCRPLLVLQCDKIVETKGPAGKMNGRVSIRDSPENLSFTVTLESLTEEDAASSPQSSMGTSGPPTKLPVHTWPSVTRKDSPEPSPHPGSLFSNVRFLLLVLLELPLLLSMLDAIFWVNRPQRSSRSRQSWPEGENQ